jgi:photosystem II stability/assembly factor-like uncharacterized protein
MKFGTLILLMLFIFSVLEGDTIPSRRWRLIGPNGGVVEQIVPDRKISDLWFLLNNGVLYRSSDGARTWSSTGLHYVNQIAVHPVTSTVYALRKFRIWRSQDNGVSFHPTSLFETQYLHQIFLHPQNSDILYGLGGVLGDDLIVSFDAGRSWNAVKGLPFSSGETVGGCQASEYAFDDLLVSPFDPNVLFASGTLILSCPPRGEDAYMDLLLQSNNAGTTWKVMEKALYSFHADPLYPKRAFAFNADGIKQLTPQGWTPLSKTAVEELFTVARHENELLATRRLDYPRAGIQLLKSKDSGKTWSDLPISLSERLITIQSMDDSFRGLLGGTQGTGLFYRNELQSWKQIKVSFEAAPVSQIIRNPLSGEIMIGIPACFTCSTRFIFSKSSASAAWRELEIPAKKSANNIRIAVDPANSSHLLVASNSSIYVTHDKGKNWKRTFTGNFCCSSPAFDPSNSDVVYTVRDKSLLKSNDGGNSWSKLTARVPYISSITVDPHNRRILYFVYLNGSEIYKSTDGGASAHPISKGIKSDCKYCEINVVNLAPLQAKDSYLAVTHEGKIYKTVNGGDEWEFFANAPSSGRQKLHPADATGDHLFLWNERGRLLETTNGGKSWREISKELGPGLQIADMSDPLFSPIYLATNRGVFMEQR